MVVGVILALTLILASKSRLAMFVVSGLSLILAIRAIKHINVGEIVRERAV